MYNKLSLVSDIIFSMYFIFESGGKQHKASPGQKLRIEKLPLAVGKEMLFDKVIMRADGDKVEYGAPYLKGEVIKARVVQHGRGEKIHIIKFKRRKHHIKRQNHRQKYTEVEILKLASAEKKKMQSTTKKAPQVKKSTASASNPPKKPASESRSAKMTAKKSEKTEKET